MSDDNDAALAAGVNFANEVSRLARQHQFSPPEAMFYLGQLLRGMAAAQATPDEALRDFVLAFLEGVGVGAEVALDPALAGRLADDIGRAMGRDADGRVLN